MNGLLPIVRRVRRPLMPVEPVALVPPPVIEPVGQVPLVAESVTVTPQAAEAPAGIKEAPRRRGRNEAKAK